MADVTPAQRRQLDTIHWLHAEAEWEQWEHRFDRYMAENSYLIAPEKPSWSPWQVRPGGIIPISKRKMPQVTKNESYPPLVGPGVAAYDKVRAHG